MFSFGSFSPRSAKKEEKSPSSGPGVAIEEDEEVVERNYETECPPLYQAIEKVSVPDDWDKILHYLENGNKEGSKGPSPELQAKTWVTRFDRDDPEIVKWSQLPLHLAVVCGAPFKVIEALVNLYPQALRCTDDQHMLPLHLALRYGAHDDVVVLLLSEFPDAVNAKGKNGRTAVDCALKAKDKLRGRMLQVFIDKTKSRLSKSVLNDRAGLKATIETAHNQIDTLKTELEAQYAVVEKLRAELATAQVDLELSAAEKRQIEDRLLGKVQEVEWSKTELKEDAVAKAEALKKAKIMESLALQKKVEELEAEKRRLSLANLKSRNDEEAYRKALHKVQEGVATSASPDDWSKLKDEVEGLRMSTLDKAREDAQSEYEELKTEVEKRMREVKMSDSKVRKDLEAELKQIKRSVSKLNPDDASLKTTDDMFALREEVKKLRADLQNRTEANQAKYEVAVLKKALEAELRETEGKTHQEVEALRRAISRAETSQRGKSTADEMANIKSEMARMKKEMALTELANNTKQDVDDLQIALKKLAATTGGSKAQSALEAKVKVLSFKIGNATTKEKVILLQPEAEALKEEMKQIQTYAMVYSEAKSLKQSIDSALEHSEGKTLDTISKHKKQFKSLISGLEKKSIDEVQEVMRKLEALKKEFKTAEYASKTQHSLSDLKKDLVSQLEKENKIVEKDISSIRKAIESVDMDSQKARELKKTMMDEIKEIHSSKEAELLDFKKSVDAVDVKTIDASDSEAWFDVRRKIEGLKSLLQEKKVIEISDMENELMAMKKVAAAVNADSPAKNDIGVAAIRAEMRALKVGIKNRQDNDATIKKAIQDLKEKVSQNTPIDKKAGINKLFSRRFSKNSFDGSKHSANVAMMPSDSEAEEKEIIDDPANQIPTVLPPSLSNPSRTLSNLSKNSSSSSGSSRRSELTSSKKKPPAVFFPGSPDSSKASAALKNAVKMNRSASKTHVQDSGEVELEAVASQ